MKYKNIKKDSPVETYQDNIFLAVTDMFWDMRLNADFSKKEARKLIIRDVNKILDESIRQFEEDENADFSKKEARKLIIRDKILDESIRQFEEDD